MKTTKEVPLGGAGDGQGRARPRTVAVHALGCKANLEEMECLLSRLADAGYQVVPFGSPADWTVVNTCTVTAAADSDSRQFLRRARRGGGRILATGCLAQRAPDSLAAIEGLTWVVGNQEKPSLAQWIQDADETVEGDAVEEAVPGPGRPWVRVDADPTLRNFASYGSGTAGRRTRATLKVQDGCDEHCTFCVIPQVRGASRSRSLADVARETTRLAASGYREVALTGINTALWGRDLASPGSLIDLLDVVSGVPGIERVRLNSLEPQYVRPEWIEAIADNPRICRHLHLPLQSGDAAVLKWMNRRYDPAHYAATVEAAVSRIPELAVGADVLVGFPGETDRHFESTRSFLASLPLAYLHVFSYSVRPDTAAPRLGAEVPVEERKRRSSVLRGLGSDLRAAFLQRLEGSSQGVLPEASSGAAHWQGLTDNYVRVRFPWPAEAAPENRVHPVRIGASRSGIVSGTLLSAGNEPGTRGPERPQEVAAS